MKQQTAWAVVTERGFIVYTNVHGRRKYVIDCFLKEYDLLRRRYWPNATDAQAWRKLKNKYGWSVRRIELKVVP